MSKFFLKKNRTIIISVVISAFLIGCGDGESSTETSSDTKNNQNIEEVSITGQVVDGYINGATVFFDANDDGIWNPGEAKTKTDINGKYSLTNVNKANVDRKHSIIAFGGIDQDTRKEFKTIYKRNPSVKDLNDDLFITPLTTLHTAVAKKLFERMQNKVRDNKGIGFGNMGSRIEETFGLEKGDLFKNPLAQGNEKIYKANVAFQKTLEILSNDNKNTNDILTDIADIIQKDMKFEKVLDTYQEKTNNHKYEDSKDLFVFYNEISDDDIKNKRKEIAQKVQEQVDTKSFSEELVKMDLKKVEKVDEETFPDIVYPAPTLYQKVNKAPSLTKKVNIQESKRFPVTGKVISLFPKDATVFVDMNGNRVLDENEISTKTDENGNFNLIMNYDDTGKSSGNTLVALGGIDNHNNAFDGILFASVKASVNLTPLSSMVNTVAKMNTEGAGNIGFAPWSFASALALATNITSNKFYTDHTNITDIELYKTSFAIQDIVTVLALGNKDNISFEDKIVKAYFQLGGSVKNEKGTILTLLDNYKSKFGLDDRILDLAKEIYNLYNNANAQTLQSEAFNVSIKEKIVDLLNNPLEKEDTIPKFVLNIQKTLGTININEKQKNGSIVGKIPLAQGSKKDLKFFVTDNNEEISTIFKINDNGEIIIIDESKVIYKGIDKDSSNQIKLLVYATNDIGTNKDLGKNSKGFPLTIQLIKVPLIAPILKATSDDISVPISNTSTLLTLSDLITNIGDTKIKHFTIKSGNDYGFFKIDGSANNSKIKLDQSKEIIHADYTLELVAVNAKGESNISTVKIKLTDINVPTLKETSDDIEVLISNKNKLLNLTPLVISNGGGTITDFTIISGNTNGYFTIDNYYKTIKLDHTQTIVPGEYVLTITAKNIKGESNEHKVHIKLTDINVPTLKDTSDDIKVLVSKTGSLLSLSSLFINNGGGEIISYSIKTGNNNGYFKITGSGRYSKIELDHDKTIPGGDYTLEVVAINSKGESNISTIKIKLNDISVPTIKTSSDDIEVFLSKTGSLLSLYYIVKENGGGKITSFTIKTGNDKGYFKITGSGRSSYIYLDHDKTIAGGDYTLGIIAINSKGESNESTINIKLKDVVAPTLKNITYKIKSVGSDNKIVGFWKGSSYVNLVEDLHTFDYYDLTFELAEPSASYEIQTYGSGSKKWYGLGVKEGQEANAETLKIKVTTTYKGKTLTSNIVKLTLTK